MAKSMLYSQPHIYFDAPRPVGLRNLCVQYRDCFLQVSSAFDVMLIAFDFGHLKREEIETPIFPPGCGSPLQAV